MRKGTNSNCILGKLIADVRRAKAVSHAGKLDVICPVPIRDGFGPSRDGLIGKGSVFALPRLIVKVGIGVVVTIFAVFPYRVLNEPKPESAYVLRTNWSGTI